MLKIRLQRIGRKNDPSFRVVVTEHTRGPKSEKHVDRVGFYNPKTKEQKLDADKITHWISKGAQASGTVHNMLLKAGIIKGKAINVLPQKSPVVKEVAEKETAPAVDAAETPAVESEGAEEKESTDEDEAPAAEEAPVEEVKEETKEEAPTEAEKEDKKEE